MKNSYEAAFLEGKFTWSKWNKSTTLLGEHIARLKQEVAFM
jgi:hypothetical protein